MQKLSSDNPLYYQGFSEYTPRAVRTYRDEDGQKKYAWSATPAEEDDHKFDDDLTWVPALANSHSCIPLSETFLMSRRLAEADAKEIAKNLKIASEKW